MRSCWCTWRPSFFRLSLSSCFRSINLLCDSSLTCLEPADEISPAKKQIHILDLNGAPGLFQRCGPFRAKPQVRGVLTGCRRQNDRVVIQAEVGIVDGMPF